MRRLTHRLAPQIRRAGRSAPWRARRGRLAATCIAALLVGGLLLISPWGCTPRQVTPSQTLSSRTLRVRIVRSANQVLLAASQPVVYNTADGAQRRLELPAGRSMPLTLAADGWRIGSANLGQGQLDLHPAVLGALNINGFSYRGFLRLVPLDASRFEVVNYVDVEGYLQGVLARELYPGWDTETFKAQAIAARTYALYEKLSLREGRHYDLNNDQSSQVYGGIAAETPKSREAVAATAGIVLVYGAPGQAPKIFKAYFSSCCGGVSQSVADAFYEPLIPPLSEQDVGTLCSASTKYNWGPLTVTYEELTRRVRLFGQRKGRREQHIGMIRGVEIIQRNRHGRPVRFALTDAAGTQYILNGEEFRWAFNTDAPAQSTLPSSFVESIINESDRVRIPRGHGYGHGVGLCQWCSEARARAGARHEDIVLFAYPGAKLVKAY